MGTDLDLFADAYLAGNVYQKVTSDLEVSVGVPAFRFRNDLDETVFLITSTDLVDVSLVPDAPNIVPAGSLLMKGRLFMGGDPDNVHTSFGI